METFSASLAICVGNSPVTGEFPAQRPAARSFDGFFDLRLIKRLSKLSWGWWFEMPSRLLWRHCDDNSRAFCIFSWKWIRYVQAYLIIFFDYYSQEFCTIIKHWAGVAWIDLWKSHHCVCWWSGFDRIQSTRKHITDKYHPHLVCTGTTRTNNAYIQQFGILCGITILHYECWSAVKHFRLGATPPQRFVLWNTGSWIWWCLTHQLVCKK